MPFNGLRVLSLESRRALEMATLIRNQGGEPIVAPSMREVPIERNEAAFTFAENLFAGQFDMVILLTGVGLRYLDKILATRYPPEQFANALKNVTIIARGPKPMGVLREMKIPGAIMAQEPNTWREVLALTDGRPERRVALQEHGRPAPELVAALRDRGCDVTPVPVYQWEIPEDVAPLQDAARQLANGSIDVVLLTTAIQVPHLLQVAEDLGLSERVRAALKRAVLSSVGPTTSETLNELDLPPDMEPSHPKMGNLVLETAQRAADILRAKTAAHA